MGLPREYDVGVWTIVAKLAERVGEVLGERMEANYAQVLTLDLLRKGFVFEEVPIHYRLREHGASFVDWRYPAKVLRHLARVASALT